MNVAAWSEVVLSLSVWWLSCSWRLIVSTDLPIKVEQVKIIHKIHSHFLCYHHHLLCTVCLSVHLSDHCLSIRLSVLCLSICLTSLCLSVCPSVWPLSDLCLSVCSDGRESSTVTKVFLVELVDSNNRKEVEEDFLQSEQQVVKDLQIKTTFPISPRSSCLYRESAC